MEAQSGVQSIAKHSFLNIIAIILILAVLAGVGVGAYVLIKKPCWDWITKLDKTYQCVEESNTSGGNTSGPTYTYSGGQWNGTFSAVNLYQDEDLFDVTQDAQLKNAIVYIAGGSTSSLSFNTTPAIPFVPMPGDTIEPSSVGNAVIIPLNGFSTIQISSTGQLSIQ